MLVLHSFGCARSSSGDETDARDPALNPANPTSTSSQSSSEITQKVAQATALMRQAEQKQDSPEVAAMKILLKDITDALTAGKSIDTATLDVMIKKLQVLAGASAATTPTATPTATIVPDRPPTWNSSIGSQWAVQGVTFSVSASASDQDSTDTVVYSLAGTNLADCPGQTWSVTPSVNASSGAITATPSSVNDVTACTVAVNAASGGVTISQSFTLTLYPAAPAGFTCDSGNLTSTCTITGTHTLTAADLLAGPGHLVIQSGGVITTAATQFASIKMGGNVTIQSGGTISASLTVLTATNLTVAGSINVNGKGFAGGAISTRGSGPAGGSDGQHCGGGGTHGGDGSWSDSGCFGLSSAGATYGSAVAPITLGSGGGGSDSAMGGAGGGAVKISVSGTISISGTISANGSAGGLGASRSGGGGAGGSIWLIASQLSGSGVISADGAAAPSGAAQTATAGGGGRIAINATTSTFNGTVSHESPNAGRSVLTGDGTFVMTIANPCDTGSLATTCTISASKIVGTTTISSTGNVVVAAGANVRSTTPATSLTLNTTGDVTIQSGGTITSNMAATARIFTIEASGTLSAVGLGYRYSGRGPGGAGSGGHDGGGAAHAGIGGNGGSDGVGSVITYGSNVAPVTKGSSGATAVNGNTAWGGNGGGVIKITTSQSAVLDGAITAAGSDGGTDGSYAGGGGAGGSVWIIAGTSVSGSGNVSVIGGNGLNPGHAAGGGGGGRVALQYSSSTFAGTFSNSGGTGANNGGQGTVCLNGGGAGC